jgi:hypothetical protein
MAQPSAESPRAKISYRQICTRKEWLMGLIACFDDSGTDLQGPVVVLAGVAIESGSLTEFSDAWDAALREPPKIEYLKMSEASYRRGQFECWPKEDRNAKLRRLADVLKPYALFGYGAGLPDGRLSRCHRQASDPQSQPLCCAVSSDRLWTRPQTSR